METGSDGAGGGPADEQSDVDRKQRLARRHLTHATYRLPGRLSGTRPGVAAPAGSCSKNATPTDDDALPQAGLAAPASGTFSQ